MKKLLSALFFMVMTALAVTVTAGAESEKEIFERKIQLEDDRMHSESVRKDSVWSDTYGFEYNISASGWLDIYNNSSTVSDIVIPSVIDGIEVEYVWVAYNENIESITLPATVTEMFDYSDACQNIYVSSDSPYLLSYGGVLYSADWTTLKCYPSGRTDWYYYVPEGCNTIGCNMYNGYLEEVYLSSTVSTLAYDAFGNARNLETISVDSYNPYFKSVNGVLLSADGTELVKFPRAYCRYGNYTIPTSVIAIRDNAFFNAHLSTLTISSNVSIITSTSFRYGEFEEFLVSSGNSYFKAVNGVLYTKDGKCLIKYPDYKGGESFAVPSGVTSISDNAFEYANYLKNVTLPSTLTRIGYDSFYYCWYLEKIYIPRSVTYIDNCAFVGDTDLVSVYYGGSSADWNELLYGEYDWDYYSLEDATIYYNAYCPRNVKATAGDGSVKISWSAVDCATKYRVQRTTGSSWTTVAYPTATSYTDTSVTNGTTYKYRVLAYVGGEWTDASATVSAKPYGTTPKNLKATAGNKSVKLSWSAVSGATKYRVQRYINSAWSTVSYPTTNSYTDTGLTNGTTYKYRVLAYVNNAWSSASASVSAKPYNTVPQSVKAIAGNKNAKITWKGVSGATKYRVQRTTGSSWSTVAYPTALSYINTGLSNGTTYKYRVLAFVNNEWSPASAVVSAKPFDTTPKNVKAVAGDKRVTISWTAVSGAEKYRVQRYSGSSWSTLAYPTTNSYTNTGLTNGTTYKYRVLVSVNGEWSPVSAVVSAKPSVSKLTGLNVATLGNRKVVIKWNAVNGATKYRVQRTTGSTWTTVAYPTSASYTDTSVLNGTTYKYRVLAYVSGAWGDPSASVTAKPGDYAPKNLTASSQSTKIQVSWYGVSGATKYRLQRRTASTSWATVDYPVTNSYTDTNLVSGTVYYYRVLAFVNGAWSECSLEVSVYFKASGSSTVG